MSNEEKCILIIEFSGKKADRESWSKKFLLHGKHKGYKKLLASSGSTSSMDKIPTQDKYENALEGDMDLNQKIIKLGELNKLVYEDLILSVNNSSSVGKVAFGLARNMKSPDFLEGDCKIVWDRLVSEYAPHTHLSSL